MPNFCKNSTVLMLLLSVLLCGLVLELVSSKYFDVEQFSMRLVYIAWVVLGAALVLCVLKRHNILTNQKWLAVLICLLVFCVIELTTQFFILNGFDLNRFGRFSIVAVILSLVVFRLFDLFHLYQQRSISRMEARIQGLQSKIEPHFLFNSLNTIAELAHLDADKAELSIQSLSALLRNNLVDDDHMHDLEHELDLTQHYIELERLRLGERLRITLKDEIEIAEKRDIVIPKLIIQPLVENAIRYGVAPSVDGGDIVIELFVVNKKLTIRITNSLSVDIKKAESGAGIALKNIRERLFVIYDDQHRFITSEKDSLYIAEIVIPKRVDEWRQS